MWWWWSERLSVGAVAQKAGICKFSVARFTRDLQALRCRGCYARASPAPIPRICVPLKPRILIVEDEPAIRAGLVDVFVYHGFEVEFAVDGALGLTLALGGTFDLILLDVMLPGRNGFDICAAIREVDREQPIIMLTAKSSDEDAIRGLALGADDYVSKPFSVAQLVLRVQAVLRRSGVGAPSTDVISLAPDAQLDLANLSACIGGQVVRLTRRERRPAAA